MNHVTSIQIRKACTGNDGVVYPFLFRAMKREWVRLPKDQKQSLGRDPEKMEAFISKRAVELAGEMKGRVAESGKKLGGAPLALGRLELKTGKYFDVKKEEND